MDPRTLAERLTIATPCEMRWEEMKGDARVRHCGACRLNVYNVSEMSMAEVEALLQPGGRVCARLYRRFDGTVVTGDCRRVWRQQRAEAVTLLGTAVTVTAVLSLLVVIGLLTLTLFGDNIRALFGASAGGLAVAPAPSSGTAASSPATRLGAGTNHY
ncbi:hypothetical protein HPC49_31205 [Pyxidicoccus fallax]|uniref:Uncharacterized protein n=1 Tax=Pyxidicoccus fallax TaxID=394095 RepID=A0A848LAB7_9BACT|nr:hypothetical protein [Pyxidicoccus fallax]NMO13633.1 hypothetical protein [Pyxidicoccus fallax]NPC82679.1 hypothetical protein [Pyxidicoccus fallax]